MPVLEGPRIWWNHTNYMFNPSCILQQCTSTRIHFCVTFWHQRRHERPAEIICKTGCLSLLFFQLWLPFAHAYIAMGKMLTQPTSKSLTKPFFRSLHCCRQCLLQLTTQLEHLSISQSPVSAFPPGTAETKILVICYGFQYASSICHINCHINWPEAQDEQSLHFCLPHARQTGVFILFTWMPLISGSSSKARRQDCMTIIVSAKTYHGACICSLPNHQTSQETQLDLIFHTAHGSAVKEDQWIGAMLNMLWVEFTSNDSIDKGHKAHHFVIP